MNYSFKNKILVLPSFYPTDLDFPRGNFFQEQTFLFKKAGLDVSVVFNELRSLKTFNFFKLRKAHFQKELYIENEVPVFRLKGWNLIPTKFDLGKRLWIYNSVKLVKEYIRIHGAPDLIHAHCAFNAGIVAMKIKEDLGIPYIITEHSTSFALKKLSFKNIKQALNVYNNAFQVIAVSTPFKNLISEVTNFPKESIQVIPNFIDIDFFSPNIVIKSDQKTIFCVCYHEKKKRLDRLIYAFTYIKTKFPTTKLILGGNGPETSFLNELVHKLNLTNSVVFTGFLSKELVKKYLNTADVFVLPSDVETFGVVLIEALSMGVPVIATKSGGPEDIINDSVGVLVDKEVDKLTQAMCQVLSGSISYNPLLLRQYVIENYSIDAVYNKYLNIYNSI